ncbi:MAG TPA: FAD-dependent oxidoreductase [Thermoanaerobaculia bacterium]|nr:FAD-dependent oxidoreductase [Thermoanaerobaculia bacterium]
MSSCKATVTGIEELAPSVLQLTLALSDEKFSFQPGQWVNFHFPDGVSRAYTIASAPQRPHAVQLCVRVGSGRGSTAIQKLNAGDTVCIDGPHGDFVLPAGDARDLVFLAGDTGIAPVRSIVLHMLATGDPRRICVLYEPDQRCILYAADFDPLARAGQIAHMSGAVESLIERNRSAIPSSVVMAVGFDEFLDRARAALRKIDMDLDAAIFETFGRQP